MIGGVFSGTFGIGGGVIMVPLILWLLRYDQRRAGATSLAAILPTTIVGSVGYAAAGRIDLLAGALIAAGGIVGTIVGTRLLRSIPLGWLRWGFVGLLLLIAVRTLLVVPMREAEYELGWLAMAGLVLLGLVMGLSAGLFGVAGGVLAVPVLMAVFGMSDLVAKGTSLLALILPAVTGTVANARARLVRPGDALVIGITAAASSFGGIALAFLMPPIVSGVLFGVLVLVVAAQLAVRAYRLRGTDR